MVDSCFSLLFTYQNLENIIAIFIGTIYTRLEGRRNQPMRVETLKSVFRDGIQQTNKYLLGIRLS